MEKSVESVYETWLDSQRSDRTRRTYKGNVERFCDMLFHKRPVDITGDNLSADTHYPSLVQFKQSTLKRSEIRTSRTPRLKRI